VSRLAYESAETLVYDPVAANRTATRSALYNLGFRRIETAPTLEALTTSIKERSPDLVLAEAQGAEGELCTLIQGLRQGISGHNPFLVIIVTAWENSGPLVRRVIDSGADDLILRPFSTTILGQRILTHIERRKSFVITSDYVGPDRRKSSARPSNTELFNPPNSLQMKVKDYASSEQGAQKLEMALKAARENLRVQKLRRDAFQICILWRLIGDQSAAGEKFVFDVGKLKEVTRSVQRRCLEGEMEAAAQHCEAILGAVEGLDRGQNRNVAMQQLGHAALSLNQAVDPTKSSTDHLEAIDATVTVIRARNQVPLAS